MQSDTSLLMLIHAIDALIELYCDVRVFDIEREVSSIDGCFGFLFSIHEMICVLLPIVVEKVNRGAKPPT